ncbi:MAG TPA: maleylpyruvate isomerase N-terminal domain-containing protein [Micromonosporaceae bacterium]|nr:maleylpyruvate isomerase N-terminal domain-containing protein [Micromonosporaceae bacterium]
MSEWDATTYDAKDNLLRVVHREAEQMFALAEAPGAWESPTACPLWKTGDVVGHLIDVTESYFVGFDAAHGRATAPEPLGLLPMAQTLDEGARAYRTLSTMEAMDRVRADFAKMMEISGALGADDWGGLVVTHKFMGPLPAFFYPTFQLMDYAVHSWDIRQGIGKAHAIAGDAADILVPFMFILWQATTAPSADTPSSEIGIRVTGGHNAGTWRVTTGPEGMSYAPGEVGDLPAVLEFDPASLVLTAFGRSNFGTIRGDVPAAERFLNLFFRI